jgi:hypothetical protein
MAVYTKLTRLEMEELVNQFLGDDVELVSFDPIAEGVSNTNYLITTRKKRIYKIGSINWS